MQLVMATRPRLVVDTSLDLQVAVKIRAAALNKSVSQLLEELLRREFTEELQVARKYTQKNKEKPG